MSTTEHPRPATVPDDPDAAPVPVDQAPARPRTAFDRITAHREGAKQPILVPWLKVAEERTAILRWALGYAWHIARFHAARLPVYQLRFMLWAAPRDRAGDPGDRRRAARRGGPPAAPLRGRR